MTEAQKRRARMSIDFSVMALVLVGLLIASGARLPESHHYAPVHEQPGRIIQGTPAPMHEQPDHMIRDTPAPDVLRG